MSHSPETLGYPGWRVAGGALLALGFGYSAYISYYFGVFLPPLAAAYGWSRGEIALGVSLGNLTTMFTAPLLGLAVDRFGPRPAILLSTVMFALAVAALSLLPASLPLFYAAHVVLALAALGTLPLTYTALLVGWFERRRGLALGLALAGVGLGGAAVSPLLAGVIATQGWRSGYLLLAALMAVATLPVALFLLKPNPANERRTAAVDRSATALWTNSVFLRLLFIFAALGVMTLGISVHLVAMLGDAGYPPRTAAAGVTVLGLSLVGGRLVAGPLLDRLHAPYVAAVFVVLATLGLVLIASGVGGMAIFFAIALIGLGIGAEFDFMSYLISRYLGLGVYGRAYGFTYAAFQLGCAIGPLLLGRLYDADGTYAQALWIVAAMTSAAAIVLARLPRYPAD